MKMLRLCAVAMLLLLPCIGRGQDFDGFWHGYLIVKVDGSDVRLDFAMTINRDGGGQYSGQTKLLIPVNGVKYYILSEMTGHNDGDKLVFSDGAVMEPTRPDDPAFAWCSKFGRLYFRKAADGEVWLVGNVDGKLSGRACMPAVAELRKGEVK
jgi:hypothetical protein